MPWPTIRVEYDSGRNCKTEHKSKFFEFQRKEAPLVSYQTEIEKTTSKFTIPGNVNVCMALQCYTTE